MFKPLIFVLRQEGYRPENSLEGRAAYSALLSEGIAARSGAVIMWEIGAAGGDSAGRLVFRAFFPGVTVNKQWK